jgi:hypothetical protein
MTNSFATVSATLGSSVVAFIEGSRDADAKATPFGRSFLAATVSGLYTVSLAETLVIASFGAPKSPATGKPIATVSGLRTFNGGASVYQAWKALVRINDNIDADSVLVAATDDTPATPGACAIRKLVEGFILETDGAPKALFGPYGLVKAVDEALKAHGKALAALNGVTGDEPGVDGDKPAEAVVPAMSLTDRAAALLVAINAATDDELLAAYDAIDAIVTAMDARIAADAAPANDDDTVTAPVMEAAE